jgi:molecular chaperone IbpA
MTSDLTRTLTNDLYEFITTSTFPYTYRFIRNAKPQFPPANIFYENSGKYFIIEMAIAGFSKEDIQVVTEDEFLIVKGKKENESDKGNFTYLSQALNTKEFERTFEFPNSYFDFHNPEVTLINGILTIKIGKNPELISEKKAIEIK